MEQARISSPRAVDDRGKELRARIDQDGKQPQDDEPDRATQRAAVPDQGQRAHRREFRPRPGSQRTVPGRAVAAGKTAPGR